jgi:hypothetical protein
MNKVVLLVVLYMEIFLCATAQQGAVKFKLQTLAGYTGPESVPFWLRSNQFGSVPLAGASLGLIGAMQKDYDRTGAHIAGWGFSAEGRLNVGNPTHFILTEGYGKFRLSIFELKAGRVREINGLCDTLLTSGSWSVSGNAPGIPKIQLAIPEFYTLPMLGKLFAIKGSYMHGWIGNWYINDEAAPNTPTYVHQKSLYGRFGKPAWKLKLYGGFNHQVIWGNEKNIILGSDYELSLGQTYYYMLTGKRYNNGAIKETRIGNHLGSIDLGLQYDFRNIGLFVYRQNFYDAGALFYMANILDGLNGVSITNKRQGIHGFQWKKLLVEFLYTKNQAGEAWSRWTPSAFENYYNNGYYKAGWSYKGIGLGNPFISPSNAIKEELAHDPESFFANNRVIAIHTGLAGYLFGWDFVGKFSYSRNYGTYLTSSTGKVHSGTDFPYAGIFPTVGQFSAFLETSKNLKKGLKIGLMAAFDRGDLYNESFGIMGSISKSF